MYSLVNRINNTIPETLVGGKGINSDEFSQCLCLILDEQESRLSGRERTSSCP